MAGKKNPNWLEIEARYKAGEKAKAIAADYRGVTDKAIYQRARRGKWVEEREEARLKIADEISGAVTEQIKSNAIAAVSLEQELIDFQRMLLRKGREYYEFIEKSIEEHAAAEASGEDDEGCTKFDTRKYYEVVQRMRDMYYSLMGRFLPQSLITAAYKTARETLNKPEEQGANNEFVLTIRKQGIEAEDKDNG